MGECGSAREVVMVIQEEAEKIAENAQDGDEDAGDESAVEEKTSSTERLVELFELSRAGPSSLFTRFSQEANLVR
jgi:hypothetical protein